jgi:DNA topoisomerase I
VVASVGHIRDLPAKKMAVDLQTFEPTYQLTERGAEVVSRLKTLVSRAVVLLIIWVLAHIW